MKKFNQFFWVFLPMFLYGIFWSIWSFLLHKPVPVVDKFVWMGERAQRTLLPNLPDPHNQFIYFLSASRWWDVALAPVGALILVWLYYSKWINNDDYAYEDVNFSWKNAFRVLGAPFKTIGDPIFSWWHNKRADRVHNARYARLRHLTSKHSITDADAREIDVILSQQRADINHLVDDLDVRQRKMMGEDDMMGVRTWLAYGFLVSFFFGLLSGPPAAASEGFGFFAVRGYFPAMVGILLIFTRRIQIATIGFLSCWIGCWYGFSIGTGMVAGFIWLSYVFVPVGLFMLVVHYSRSHKNKVRPNQSENIALL